MRYKCYVYQDGDESVIRVSDFQKFTSAEILDLKFLIGKVVNATLNPVSILVTGFYIYGSDIGVKDMVYIE